MIIGITGGIASGKSTLSRYLKEKGFTIVDADKLAYDALTIDEVCINKVKKDFDCLDEEGEINRQKLGTIIFNNKMKQKQLEDIVHPYVIGKIKEAIQQHNEEILFLDIPLLYESHLEYLCDYIIVVYVSHNIQIERLITRNHLTVQEAMSRIQSQMPLIDKKRKAHYVFDNNQTVDQLYLQIDLFLNNLKKGVVTWQK